jgi:hypothetical protein
MATEITDIVIVLVPAPSKATDARRMTASLVLIAPLKVPEMLHCLYCAAKIGIFGDA